MSKILVVDDEEEIVSMLKKNLKSEGYDVEGATDRESALSKMKDEIYSIVLLDIKFPETSGQELLQTFKEINPLVNVVMITGYSSVKNVIECLGDGAVDYFTKPLDLDELLRVVNDLDEKVNRWNETIGMG